MISINSLIDGYIDSEACLRMKFSCTGTEQALFPEEQQQGDPVGNVGGKFGRQHRPVDETSAVFQPRPVRAAVLPLSWSFRNRRRPRPPDNTTLRPRSDSSRSNSPASAVNCDLGRLMLL